MVLRGNFLQSRVFGAQNQSDFQNAEKAIEYSAVYSYIELNRQIPYKLTSVQILKMQNGHQLKSSQHYAKYFDRF